MKKIKLILIAGLACLSLVSCTGSTAVPAYTSPPGYNMPVVNPDAHVQPAVLSAYSAEVPKTKVYHLNRYYGMTAKTDVSGFYRNIKIRFRLSPYSDYIYQNPSLTPS